MDPGVPARPRPRADRLDLDAGRAATARRAVASSRWTCAVTACPTRRPRPAPTTSPRPRGRRGRRGGGLRAARRHRRPRRPRRARVRGHRRGRDRRALGARCAGLVLVDGGWESIEASTGLDIDEFLRGLDEPPEVMRSMTAFLADRQAFDPTSWDADQERAARATVVETHAGRVVPVTRPHVIEACVRTMFAYDPVDALAAVEAPVVALVAAAPSDDEPGARERALAAVDAARGAAGRSPIRSGVVPPRWAQPDALPSGCGQRGDPVGRRATPAIEGSDAGRLHAGHLGHDITIETFMGRRSPRTRWQSGPRSSGARSRPTAAIELVAPTEHGEGADHRGPRSGPAPVPRGRLVRGPPPAARRSRSCRRTPTPTARCSRA